MSAWCLRMKTSNTNGNYIQVIRRKRKTTTHGTRCWRRSRCWAPAQRYNRACRIGSTQGGMIVSLCVGHPVHVHGVVSRGATAETSKEKVMRACAHLHQGVESRGATATRQASLRVMCDTYWEIGSEAKGTRLLSGLDTARTGSKCTRDGIRVLLEHFARNRIIIIIITSNRCPMYESSR